MHPDADLDVGRFRGDVKADALFLRSVDERILHGADNLSFPRGKCTDISCTDADAGAVPPPSPRIGLHLRKEFIVEGFKPRCPAGVEIPEDACAGPMVMYRKMGEFGRERVKQLPRSLLFRIGQTKAAQAALDEAHEFTAHDLVCLPAAHEAKRSRRFGFGFYFAPPSSFFFI